jgi:hypothetical protein
MAPGWSKCTNRVLARLVGVRRLRRSGAVRPVALKMRSLDVNNDAGISSTLNARSAKCGMAPRRRGPPLQHRRFAHVRFGPVARELGGCKENGVGRSNGSWLENPLRATDAAQNALRRRLGDVRREAATCGFGCRRRMECGHGDWRTARADVPCVLLRENVYQLFELAVLDKGGREQAAVSGVNQRRRDEEWILKAAKKNPGG